MTRLAVMGIVVSAALTAAPVEAQRVEVGAGGGYAFGGGVEDPGPSLATLDACVAIWPLENWGVAVRRVSGPGEDLLDTPFVSADRTFLGQADLHYWTATARYRRPIGRSAGVQVGLGFQKSGQFSTVWMFNGQRRVAPDTFFGGAALELLATRRVWRRFALHGGVTVESNLETTNVHPVLLAVVGF